MGTPEVPEDPRAVPGLDIAWFGAANASMCPLDFGAKSDLSHPCDSNSDLFGFSMAFRAPAGISKLAGESFIVEVQGPGSVLAPWWHLEDRNDALGVLPGCRGSDPLTGQLSSFRFSTSHGSASTATCKDYWQGGSIGAPCYTAVRRPTWGQVKSLYR